MNITKILGLMTHADTINYPDQPVARIHRQMAGQVETAAAAAGLDAAAMAQVVQQTSSLCRDPIGPRNRHGVMACLPQATRLKNLEQGKMSAAAKSTMLPVNLARILIDVRKSGAVSFDVASVSDTTSNWFAGYAVLLRDKDNVVFSVSLFDPNNIKLASVAPQTLPQLTALEPELRLMRLVEQFGLKGELSIPRGDDPTTGARQYVFRNGEIIRRLDGTFFIKTSIADVPSEVVSLAAKHDLGVFKADDAAMGGKRMLNFDYGAFYISGAEPSTLERIKARGLTIQMGDLPLTYPTQATLNEELQVTSLGIQFGLGEFISSASTIGGGTRYVFREGDITCSADAKRTLKRDDGTAIPSQVLALCAQHNFGSFLSGGLATNGAHTYMFDFGSIECSGAVIERVKCGGLVIDHRR